MEEYSKQFPKHKNESSKPTIGKLWYNGKVIVKDKPFKFLQYTKKKLLATGYYLKDKFKITY